MRSTLHPRHAPDVIGEGDARRHHSRAPAEIRTSNAKAAKPAKRRLGLLCALRELCVLGIDHRGATPRPRTFAPTMRTPTFTSFGFDPTGTRYSISISLVRRSASRSSAAWYDEGE